jgi:mycothiol synthase
MIVVRAAESDADLEAWREVRIALLPNERAPSVEELRRLATPDKIHLLAELDARVVGSGIARRSDLEGFGTLAARVVPAARRRGVGTALLRELATHLVTKGFERAFSVVDDPGSLAFAERFGFREVARQVEQVRAVGDEPAPRSPEGVTIVSVAERPELWPDAYEALAVEVLEDIPAPAPLAISADDWEREWMSWPEGTFVALVGDEIVGCAGLLRDDDHPWRAEHSLTAVRRDCRGRGIASALKRTTIAWASESGVRELYTWTQLDNEAMRRLNEHLGYVTRSECLSLEAPLPLP